MIEILMGTFNGSAFLEQQIKSILNQTYTEWTLTIRDDGSTDGTIDIIYKYARMYPEKIRFVEDMTPSGSAKNNFLRLIKQSHSEYVMFCDQDDVWMEGKIADTYARMKAIEATSGIEKPVLIYSDLCVVDENLSVISDSYMDYMKLYKDTLINHGIIQNNVTGCTVMINNRLLEMLKKVDENSNILMHDHIAAILAMAYGEVSYIDSPLIKYRQHSLNEVGAEAADSIEFKKKRVKKGKSSYIDRMKISTNQVAVALEIGDAFDYHTEYIDILKEYADLFDKKKLGRIMYFVRYKVYRPGILRRIGQLLWA